MDNIFILQLFSDPVYFCRVVIVVILSITLHELAHGWAATMQGDDTPEKSGHLTLNPVVHMGVPSLIFLFIAGIAWGAMPVDPSSFKSKKWGSILVAAAGPLSNLALGIVLALLLKLSFTLPLGQVISKEFLWLAATLNFMLFIFNLLPVPPLDGFHVVSEFFPFLKSFQDSPFGAMALMIIFFSPWFGIALQGLSSLMMMLIVGSF